MRFWEEIMNYRESLNRTTKSAVVMGFVAVAMIMVIPGQAIAQDKIVWRLQSHWSPGSTSFDKSLPAIQERFAQCSDGRLELDIYPAGALFSAQETFAAVKRGVIQ